MNYSFEIAENFRKEVKRLSKKYRSLKNDLMVLQSEIIENPNIGEDLGSGFRKLRLKIASKNTGKSGGARVITLNVVIDQTSKKIIFVTIWDKSEIANIDIEIIKKSFNQSNQ